MSQISTLFSKSSPTGVASGRRLCAALMLVVIAASAVATAAPPPATVYIDLDNLSTEQKTGITTKLQSMANSMLGAGQITITTDASATADRSIIFKNEQSPGDPDRWGDSGDGTNSNVYIREFTEGDDETEAFDTLQKQINGLAETGFHELLHTYGADHNKTSTDILCEGGLVSMADRAADHRTLNADDKTKVINNIKKAGNTTPAATGTKDARVYQGTGTPTGAKAEQVGAVDAVINGGGAMASDFTFGWLADGATAADAFVFKWEETFTHDLITMHADDEIQFAVRGMPGTTYDGLVFTLSDYGDMVLSDDVTHPGSGDTVSQTMQLGWDVDGIAGDDVYFTLDAAGDSVGSGFTQVPEPATLSVLVLGSLTLLRRRRK